MTAQTWQQPGSIRNQTRTRAGHPDPQLCIKNEKAEIARNTKKQPWNLVTRGDCRSLALLDRVDIKLQHQWFEPAQNIPRTMSVSHTLLDPLHPCCLLHPWQNSSWEPSGTLFELQSKCKAVICEWLLEGVLWLREVAFHHKTWLLSVAQAAESVQRVNSHTSANPWAGRSEIKLVLNSSCEVTNFFKHRNYFHFRIIRAHMKASAIFSVPFSYDIEFCLSEKPYVLPYLGENPSDIRY